MSNRICTDTPSLTIITAAQRLVFPRMVCPKKGHLLRWHEAVESDASAVTAMGRIAEKQAPGEDIAHIIGGAR